MALAALALGHRAGHPGTRAGQLDAGGGRHRPAAGSRRAQACRALIEAEAGAEGNVFRAALPAQWDAHAAAGHHSGADSRHAEAASRARCSRAGACSRAARTDGRCGPAPARDYCLNIADAAADARFAWQKKVLAEIEQEIAKRVELLEAKTAEYQRWLARRDEFSKKAQESVVTIYARMRPDAAAAQLVAMDEETAAAVLTKLDPRNASAILNEMDATQAARLTATIGGAANVNLPGKSKPQPGDKKS